MTHGAGVRGAATKSSHNPHVSALPTASTDAPTPQLRQELLRSLDELKDASDRLHEALYTAAGSFSLVRSLLESDHEISELTEMIDPVPMRMAMADSMTELERARHKTQRALFRLLGAEGFTNAEIARRWGISRQLVSRLVNEGDEDAG